MDLISPPLKRKVLFVGEQMRTDVVRLGRLSGERTGEMMHFLSSMRADRYIADADVLVDIAHVLMLDKQKIIDRDITKQLIPALLELFHPLLARRAARGRIPQDPPVRHRRSGRRGP